MLLECLDYTVILLAVCLLCLVNLLSVHRIVTIIYSFHFDNGTVYTVCTSGATF